MNIRIKTPAILLMLAGILLLTFFAYLPSLENGFTNWDDNVQVLENPDIQSFSKENVEKVFSSFYVGMYQPITMLIYSMIYQLSGPDPLAYHSVSLFLHLLNILLAFILIYLLCGKSIPALIASALFALSPMQIESVCWVSAMSNLLYTSYYITGLIAYIFYRKNKNISWYYVTLAFFILSLLSKSSAVTFPLLLICIDIYLRKAYWYRRLLEKIPFLILSITIGIITIYARAESGHTVDIAAYFGVVAKIILPFYALSFYIQSLFIPLNLSALHPYPQDFPTVYHYLAVCALCLMAFLVLRLKGDVRRQVLAGILFFLITISVVLDLIPIGVQVVRERYVYLPSIGIYFAFAIFLTWLLPSKLAWLRYTLLVLILSAFFLQSVQRSYAWKDSFSLWNDALSKYPESSVALINRGNAWQEISDMRKAVEDYSMAIRYEPLAADAYMNRALAYYQLEKPEQALHDFNKAIELGIIDGEIYNSRGLIHVAAGNYQMAIKDFKEAVQLDASEAVYYVNLGLVQASLQNFNAAINTFSTAISLDARSAKAYYWRGMVYLQLNLYQTGCKDLEKAVSLGWPVEQIPESCR